MHKSELFNSALNLLIKEKYIRILLPFIKNPDKKYYVNQLKELTAVSPRILISELKILEKAGFLKKEKLANAIFYSLNQKNQDLEILRRMIR